MSFDAFTPAHRIADHVRTGELSAETVTVGTSEDTYAYNGRSGDIDLLLWPINFSLAYGGFSVLEPFIAYGVEAGLRYSDPAEVEARLKAISNEWATTLSTVDKIPSIPFNQMAHWGSDGRITPDAPVYSPFIRRKPQLPLE